jgi:hypothetical protein
MFTYWEKKKICFENPSGAAPTWFSLLYDDTKDVIHVLDLNYDPGTSVSDSLNFQLVKFIFKRCMPIKPKNYRLFIYGLGGSIMEWRGGSFQALKESDYKLIYDPYVKKQASVAKRRGSE